MVEQWTEEETKRTMVDTLKLLNAVEAYKDDWETIGRELGETPDDCLWEFL